VFVTINAPVQSASSLTVVVTLGNADAAQERVITNQAGVALPTTLLVVVGDDGPIVHVHAACVLPDQTGLAGDGSVPSTPHHQVPLTINLGSAVDGGAPDLTGPADLRPVIPDFAGVTPVTVAEDTFVRPNQPLWGIASDGVHTWTGDANSATGVFSIVNGHGRINNGGTTSYRGQLGNKVANSEAQATAIVNFWNGTSVGLGVTIRVEDANNYYKAYIDGTSFWLQKTQAGSTSTLTMVPFAAQSAVVHTIRLAAIGSTLLAKVWAVPQGEPPDWQLVASDTSFGLGFCGVRATVPLPSVVEYSHFICYQY
jgi:hypothetical protein